MFWRDCVKCGKEYGLVVASTGLVTCPHCGNEVYGGE